MKKTVKKIKKALKKIVHKKTLEEALREHGFDDAAIEIMCAKLMMEYDEPVDKLSAEQIHSVHEAMNAYLKFLMVKTHHATCAIIEMDKVLYKLQDKKRNSFQEAMRRFFDAGKDASIEDDIDNG